MIDTVMRATRHVRMALLVSFDVCCWIVSFGMLAWVQVLVGDTSATTLTRALFLGVASAVFFVLIGGTIRLHQGRSATGSLEDVLTVGSVAAFVGLMGLVIGVVGYPQMRANGVLLVAGPLVALLLMLWGRGVYRALRERYAGGGPRARQGRSQRRVLVIGGGEGGRQLVHSLLTTPDSEWFPVGILDDDPLLRHRRIRGVPTVGRIREIDDAAEAVEAEVVIIAIPSAGADKVREWSRRATRAGLEVKILPPIGEMLFQDRVEISDVRDIDVTDLLGRHVIDTDVHSIAGYLNGKRVLVTGAGGSIGSELCRQISAYDPAELIMLDRDESALHAVQLSITGRAMLDHDDTVLGDIRDVAFVTEFFERRRPEVVFHAAALKHLPLLEQAPSEAVKTNVWGTLNILEAARAYGVERFVNISTDKAANPCSVLGYTKRLAEGLTSSYASETPGTFLSVRFGNVLGSRGSVLIAFADQIAKGGPVTVTDRHVTRFFMTIAEAVQLVIQAGAVGRDGEALVLDMGEPVSIDSVAKQLIALSGKRIDVAYTGLRHGEKMHEELFADGEVDQRPVHELISHTPVPTFTPTEALDLQVRVPARDLARQLSDACLMMHAQLAVEALDQPDFLR